MSFLSSLDVFPKYKEDVKVKTIFGASVSLIALIIMIILFLSEFWDYLTIRIEDHLVIDSTNFEKLPINFNFTFNRIPCSLLSVDVIDASGSQLHVENEHISKTRLDKHGQAMGEAQLSERGGTMQEHEVIAEETKKLESEYVDPAAPTTPSPTLSPNYCGSCYGAEEKEGDCCNECKQVQDAYHRKGWGIPDVSRFEQCQREGIDGTRETQALINGEGCHIYGFFEVKRGQGNFHIAPGYSFVAAHGHRSTFGAFENGKFDASHVIHHLSFGKDLLNSAAVIENINPLDKTTHLSSFDGGSIFQYYAKVVPTQYTSIDSSIEITNQYSVTMHETKLKLKSGYGIPGVYFFYEFSPLMVQISETRKPFYHFLTQVCAIIGGIFTVTGLVDRLVYGTLKSLKFKQGINKNT